MNGSRAWTRRQWLAGSSAAGLSVALAGCGGARPSSSLPGQPGPSAPGATGAPAQAGAPGGAASDDAAVSARLGTAPYAGDAGAAAGPDPASFAWQLDERARLEQPGAALAIVERGGVDAAVLRRRARPVPPGLDLTVVAERMERTMVAAQGVGLAAPQVGLALRAVVLKVDYKTDHPRTLFVRNPVIVERSDETIEGYEMCLSIPGVGGVVRRNRWIRVAHVALDGTLATLAAEGANAVLWQHELDHLDGELYVDRVLGELLPADEVRRLRQEQEAAAGGGRSTLLSEPPGRGARGFILADHAEGTWLLGA